MGTTGPVKNVKSRTQKQSPKKNISAKRKKGIRADIPDNNTFGKLRTMKANRTVKKNEHSTHTSDGEEDEDSKHTIKVKWSFPNKSAGSSRKKDKKVEYKNFSIVKMGCNKCTEVFYSKGGYNDHLYCKHKIKNVSKYPATILNTIWQCIPALPKPKETEEMKYSCPECGMKFYERGAMEIHADFCYKLSAEDQEARAKNLYDHVEDYKRQKKLDEN